MRVFRPLLLLAASILSASSPAQVPPPASSLAWLDQMPSLAVALSALPDPDVFLPENMKIEDDPEMKIAVQLGTLTSLRRIMIDRSGIREIGQMPEKMRLLTVGYLRAELALGLQFKAMLPKNRGFFSRRCSNPDDGERRIYKLTFEQCAFELLHRQIWNFDVSYQVHQKTYPRMFGEELGMELLEMTRAHVYTTPALDTPGETLQWPKNVHPMTTADCRAWGGDTDGDAICDLWELFGVPDDGGNLVPIDEVFDYDGDGKASDDERPDVLRKDVYVEIDWLRGFKPYSIALADVERAFELAPVYNPDPAMPRRNSDEPTGIRLHNGVDEEIPLPVLPLWVSFDPSITTLGPPSACTAASAHFDSLKRCFFGTRHSRQLPHAASIREARVKVFRYALYVNEVVQTVEGVTGGVAEVGGNDFMIALRDAGWYGRMIWTWNGGPVIDTVMCGIDCLRFQASTYMHELGHALGLHHGGADDLRCKPNYLGVMNYHESYNRVLDYSRVALPTLNECALDESTGLRGGSSPDDPTWPAAIESLKGRTIAYGGANVSRLLTVAADSERIDWNNDGQITRGVKADIDWLKPEKGHPLDFLLEECKSGEGLRYLEGHDDWSNLKYNFRLSLHYNEGIAWELPSDLRPANPCPN